MSVAVIFHRLAANDFVTARRWYHRRSPSAEGRFVLAVRDAVARIESTPAAGTASIGGCLWVKVKKFPYQLYYAQVSAARVELYASPTTSGGPATGFVGRGCRELPSGWRYRQRRMCHDA